MQSPILGAQLAALCARAQSELVLAAPFVKAATLKRLLHDVPPAVNVRCITRWRPEEIVAGVSDLEVWPLLCARPNATLWLCPHLHAKYYRADGECLIGSANLTATALGWAAQPNLELLVTLPAAHLALSEFEALLLGSCSQADQSVYDPMRQAVEVLRESHAPLSMVASEEAGNAPAIAPHAWLPATRNPGDLYALYSGQNALLTLEGRRTAPDDLAFFGVPKGLGKEAFKVYMGALLLQQTVVRALDAYVQTPRHFGQIAALLVSLPCSQTPDFDGARTLETLLRWMPYFLPDRYELSGSNNEVFARK